MMVKPSPESPEFQGAPIFRGENVSFREGNQPPVYPLRPSLGLVSLIVATLLSFAQFFKRTSVARTVKGHSRDLQAYGNLIDTVHGAEIRLTTWNV